MKKMQNVIYQVLLFVRKFFVKSRENVLVFDLSIAGATRAGVCIFALNISSSLKRINRHRSIFFTNPFMSVDKVGWRRKIFSVLRMVYQELIVLNGLRGKVYIFPAPEVPLLGLIIGIKYVIFIHDLYAWKNSIDTTVFARFRNRLLRLYAQRAFKVGTVSEFSRGEIVRYLGIPKHRVFVAPNGLGEHFKSASDDNVLAPKITSRYLLTVGSIEPRKNIEFLIDIFEDIKKNASNDDLKLILVGRESWNAENSYRRLENSPFADDITIFSEADDIFLLNLYRHAEVLVYPSREEGFGIPVIEALSQSTPVIVNANSALSDYGVFGAHVIDSFSLTEWKLVIQSYLDDDIGRPSSAVVEEFCWDKSAKILLSSVR